jgi:hypothetical protein
MQAGSYIRARSLGSFKERNLYKGVALKIGPAVQPVLYTFFLKILVADAESSRATSANYLAHNFNKLDSPF